jgi:hypothetical protein
LDLTFLAIVGVDVKAKKAAVRMFFVKGLENEALCLDGAPNFRCVECKENTSIFARECRLVDVRFKFLATQTGAGKLDKERVQCDHR